MHKNSLIFLILALLLVVLAAGVIFVLVPQLSNLAILTPKASGTIGFGSDTVRAEVYQILEEGTITLGDHTQEYQVLLVELLEGPSAGQWVEVDYGRQQIRPPGLNIRPGDQLLVTVGQRPDGTMSAYFTDFVRTRPLLLLLAAFVFMSILISGWKGVRSLIGMSISLAIILGYIIPQILQGKDPVIVSVTGAFVLLVITLYLIYGWTLKTHAAALGILISLLLTGLLATFFVDLTRLTGFGSEDSLFLIQQSEITINLRGLVLGGMLIGALGVLDDLVATQASAVFELHAADRRLTFVSLYRRAMRIGQDHVAATVNTLVLAYAGAALPMLLLFSLSGEQFAFLVNLEFVTEELVRTLVGSLGLISAVPITTALASVVALYHDRLGSFRRFLGPENLGSHGHTH